MRDEMKITVVKKGEKAIMPINHSGFQWIVMNVDQNGIVLSIGPSGGFGVFINEERLREINEKFREEIKESEDEIPNDHYDTTVYNADTCRCNNGTD